MDLFSSGNRRAHYFLICSMTDNFSVKDSHKMSSVFVQCTLLEQSVTIIPVFENKIVDRRILF